MAQPPFFGKDTANNFPVKEKVSRRGRPSADEAAPPGAADRGEGFEPLGEAWRIEDQRQDAPLVM
jgi:hypothetical protein